MYCRAALIVMRRGYGLSDGEACVAALEACERTGDSCSIYAVDDELESERLPKVKPAAPAQ